MPQPSPSRRPRAFRWLRSIALAAALALGLATPLAAAADAFDAIVVRYAESAVPVRAAELPAAQYARVAEALGVTLSVTGRTHDGANVLRMFQRLPIGDAEDIAARIAQDPGVEYAVADRVRTAQVVPTGPCYASASAAIAVAGSGNSRTTACTTTGLAAGTHDVPANQGGDAGNQASVSAPRSQVVNTCVPAPRNP